MSIETASILWQWIDIDFVTCRTFTVFSVVGQDGPLSSMAMVCGHNFAKPVYCYILSCAVAIRRIAVLRHKSCGLRVKLYCFWFIYSQRQIR